MVSEEDESKVVLNSASSNLLPQFDVKISSIYGQQSLPPAIYFDSHSFDFYNRVQGFKVGSFCWATPINHDRDVRECCVLLQVLKNPDPGPQIASSPEVESDTQIKGKMSCGLTHSGALSLHASSGDKIIISSYFIKKDQIPLAESIVVQVLVESPTSPGADSQISCNVPNEIRNPGERSTIRTARERLFGVAVSVGMVAVADYGGRRWICTVQDIVIADKRPSERHGTSALAGIAIEAVVNGFRPHDLT